MTLKLAAVGNPHQGRDTIARLKAANFSVIAYEDGVKKWPVASKCLPLLAGAMHLLDSVSAGFMAEIQRLLEHAFQTLDEKETAQQEICKLMRQHGIVGESPALTSVFRSAVRFSELSDLPVLITGESGTGKELLARAVWAMDPKRKQGPFVAVNCAAVNPMLLESEFFGHRRGAFTGAERDRKGLIRAADGGVLFLDEIGELELGLQAKLLRALQENRVLGVGEDQEVPVNVRFIAASHRNIEQLVSEGKFRADLFHRLRVLLICISPLRERPADISSLIEYFLQKHRALQPESAGRASRDFMDAVHQLELPGNARQLENLVRQALVTQHHQGELELSDLPTDVLRQLTKHPEENVTTHVAANPTNPSGVRASAQEDICELVKRILDGQKWHLLSASREWERQVFQAVMERTQGNQSRAARLLGITPRCVYNKLRKYQLPV